MRDRKDLAMRNQRSFSIEFKSKVVEELLSGESRRDAVQFLFLYSN